MGNRDAWQDWWQAGEEEDRRRLEHERQKQDLQAGLREGGTQSQAVGEITIQEEDVESEKQILKRE